MAHLLIVIANNKDKFLDASLLGLNKQMLQNRLIGYRYHYLRSSVGEGTHPTPLPGS
jgi:hypothetical protein